MRIAVVSVEQVRRFLRGTGRRVLSTSSPRNLSKVTPNWLAYQLELISNFHRVQIIANQQAAVVLQVLLD